IVSGFVTSPEDQSRICLLEASPIRIASKSLMSIKVFPQLLISLRVQGQRGLRRPTGRLLLPLPLSLRPLARSRRRRDRRATRPQAARSRRRRRRAPAPPPPLPRSAGGRRHG